MDVDKIIKIMGAFEASNISELSYKEGSMKFTLKSGKFGTEEKRTECVTKIVERPQQELVETVCQTVVEVPKLPDNGNYSVIKAPLVGTFYAAKAEGAEPFVKVGDKINKGQVIGIIEAMKLMNEITSDFDGTVEEILVVNEQLIEFGQELVKIRTN